MWRFVNTPVEPGHSDQGLRHRTYVRLFVGFWINSFSCAGTNIVKIIICFRLVISETNKCRLKKEMFMCFCRRMRMNARTAFTPWLVKRRRLRHHHPAPRAWPAPRAGHCPPSPSASPWVGSGNSSDTATAPRDELLAIIPLCSTLSCFVTPLCCHVARLHREPRHLAPPRDISLQSRLHLFAAECHLTTVTL